MPYPTRTILLKAPPQWWVREYQGHFKDLRDANVPGDPFQDEAWEHIMFEPGFLQCQLPNDLFIDNGEVEFCGLHQLGDQCYLLIGCFVDIGDDDQPAWFEALFGLPQSAFALGSSIYIRVPWPQEPGAIVAATIVAPTYTHSVNNQSLRGWELPSRMVEAILRA